MPLSQPARLGHIYTRASITLWYYIPFHLTPDDDGDDDDYAGPPNSANLLTIEGPISSYSALVWQ